MHTDEAFPHSAERHGAQPTSHEAPHPSGDFWHGPLLGKGWHVSATVFKGQILADMKTSLFLCNTVVAEDLLSAT